MEEKIGEVEDVFGRCGKRRTSAVGRTGTRRTPRYSLTRDALAVLQPGFTTPDTSAPASLLGSHWTAYRDENGWSERVYFLRHLDGCRVHLSVDISEHGRDAGRLYAKGYLPEKPDDVDPPITGPRRARGRPCPGPRP